MQVRVLAAAVCAVMIAACGGGGGGGQPASEGPAEAQQPAQDPVPTPAPDPLPQPLAGSNLALAVSTSSESVAAGTTTTFTVTLTNSGPATATDVRIAPNLGRGLTLGTVTCNAAGGAVCPANPLDLASLPANGTVTLEVQAAVAEGWSADITSAVLATAANDSTIADNVGVAVVHAYSADVAVSTAGPAQPVASGNVAAYTMTVANSGPDAARQVALVNTLGAAQSLGVMSCSAAGGATCPAIVGPAMTVPMLPRGGTLVFTVPANVAANTAGSIANVMTATAVGDPQPNNNSGTARASAFITPPLVPTSISLRSDAGDFIGQGGNFAYTLASAIITGTATGNLFTLQVSGDQSWRADFAMPASQAQFVPGTYDNLQRYPFHDRAVGGLAWGGEGRGCNVLGGSFTVNSARYDAGQLSAIDLDFEQHCENSPQALRGHVAWSAGDPTAIAGPANPAPGNLWAPAVAMPAAGNYVYLESDAGDYIGNGSRATYTNANAVLTVTGSAGAGSIRVNGNESWFANFQAMTGLAQLQPGYYGSLQRYPFHNPARGGLNWSGEGRGCNTLTGWFVVDNVGYANGILAALDLRFEQHCEGMVPALRGKVHFAAADATTPPGPLDPPPAGLWSPPAGAVPAAGNYLYLSSDAGDFIGGGRTATYTPATGAFNVTSNAGMLSVYTSDWSGQFLAMNTLQRLQPGYYGGLHRYPFNNPATGGLSWSGQGRGCNTLQGWFVVDSVTYVGSILTAIDLRFEQHCEGFVPALHGAIHWAQ